MNVNLAVTYFGGQEPTGQINFCKKLAKTLIFNMHYNKDDDKTPDKKVKTMRIWPLSHHATQVTFSPWHQIRRLTPNLVPTLQIHYTYENPMDPPQYWTIGLSSSNLSCGIKIMWGLQ